MERARGRVNRHRTSLHRRFGGNGNLVIFVGMRRAFTRGLPGPKVVKASVEFVVPFHDVDSLRIVWHGHYLKYLELARTELFREVGLDAGGQQRGAHGFLVIEAGCRHIAPLRYGDRVRVLAWIRDVTHRIQIAYEITNLTRDQKAARAYTTLATVDSSGRLLLKTPQGIAERLSSAVNGQGSNGDSW
jgi:acyl-CoA thioester hydrolase